MMEVKQTPRKQQWFKDILTTGVYGFACDQDCLTRIELTPEKATETELLIPFIVVNNTCILANGSSLSVEDASNDLANIDEAFIDGNLSLKDIYTNFNIITHIISIPDETNLDGFYYARTFLRDYYRYPNDGYYQSTVPYVNPILKRGMTMEQIKEQLGFNFFITKF